MFAEDAAEFFHGRDSDTARVYTAVRRRPVTLLAGPSGCGKSSLVRAGVLPRLRAESLSVSKLRPVPGVRASVVLARALTGVLEPALGEVERLTRAKELAGLLEAGDDVPAPTIGGPGSCASICTQPEPCPARNVPEAHTPPSAPAGQDGRNNATPCTLPCTEINDA